MASSKKTSRKKTKVITYLLQDDEETHVNKLKSKEYWFQVREPLTCLAFLAPLLLCYELGVWQYGGTTPNAIRNAADCWMRNGLGKLGAGPIWVLPLLLMAILLVWHVVGRYRWEVSGETLVGMFAESLLFAFVLVGIAMGQEHFLNQAISTNSLSVSNGILHHSITFIGAGIYEEVLFRLLLLPVLYGVFRLLQLNKPWAACLSILATSLLFSLAHYVGANGDEFIATVFLFRFLAGAAFSALFIFRGFGITVGCHAAYDIIVGVLLVT
ncbi:hypothetical protein MNBD_PLANCTO02-2723 [hydrothermal vent metagenome]|uniref:CAAX prenyl protease 2/Lysostaphin resistance protein A-like domain-containing protein n=1 Tax=hydrothermal vent metagenome TaxID=652676 RepID=A0A3B1DSM5_9ZZZZ